MIGMDGMGIVGRHHKAGSQGHEILLLAAAQAFVDPQQGVQQRSGCRALLGAAAHFFVVKHRINRNGIGMPAPQKALQVGKGTLQIVQLGRGDVFPMRAPNRSLLAAIQEQIGTQDLFFFHTRGLGHKIHKAAPGRFIAQQRQHILLDAVFVPVVDGTVHMDGQVGDHQQIPVHIDQFGHQLIPLAHHHFARHGQGPVEPGCAEHPAVFFHVQLRVNPIGANVHIFFDFECGRIAVGSCDLEAPDLSLRDLKGQNRGQIAPHKILSPRLQSPLFTLVQLGKALLQQLLCNIFHHMIAAGAAVDKVDQFLGQIAHTIIPFFSNVRRHTAAALSPYPRKGNPPNAPNSNSVSVFPKVFHPCADGIASRGQHGGNDRSRQLCCHQSLAALFPALKNGGRLAGPPFPRA